MGLLKCSGQMTHMAYTSPPQMIMPANAPNALSNSCILVISYFVSVKGRQYIQQKIATLERANCPQVVLARAFESLRACSARLLHRAVVVEGRVSLGPMVHVRIGLNIEEAVVINRGPVPEAELPGGPGRGTVQGQSPAPEVFAARAFQQ